MSTPENRLCELYTCDSCTHAASVWTVLNCVFKGKVTEVHHWQHELWFRTRCLWQFFAKLENMCSWEVGRGQCGTRLAQRNGPTWDASGRSRQHRGIELLLPHQKKVVDAPYLVGLAEFAVVNKHRIGHCIEVDNEWCLNSAVRSFWIVTARAPLVTMPRAWHNIFERWMRWFSVIMLIWWRHEPVSNVLRS